MKPPAVPRRHRAGFMVELGAMREVDCSWPRRHANRPRCGRCFGCNQVAMLDAVYGRQLH